MNFLAHLYLCDGPVETKLGSMLGDLVKGRMMESLPEAVRRGVQHHRCVDVYTDQHPVFLRSVSRIKHRWGRYSPILVDVFYDHFLADGWGRFSETPLRSYLDCVYTDYHECRGGLPEIFHFPMDRIIASDRLMTYREVKGIEEALRRLSQRFQRKPVELHPAVKELVEFKAELGGDFDEFFPDLMEHAKKVARASRP